MDKTHLQADRSREKKYPYTEKLGDWLRSKKLLPCQKEMVLWWRNKGETYQQIADRFKITRSMVYFICNPKKLKEYRKNNSYKPDKAKNLEAVKKTLKKRKEIFTHYKN